VEPTGETAPAEEAGAEGPKAKPRQCATCGGFSGNIKKGRLGKGPVIEWICQTCREAERQKPEAEQDPRPVYPAGHLFALVNQLNAQARAFEAAKILWQDVASGKAEPPTEEAKASHFAVLLKDGKFVVFATNSFHAAAIAQSGAGQCIPVYKDREVAAKEAARQNARAQLFEERKAGWIAIEAGTQKFTGPEKESGKCEFPDCDRKVDDGVGVVNGEVVDLCNFCGAALRTVKREDDCQKFAFFKGPEALARAQKHLAWLRHANKPANHRPKPEDFDRIGGGLARFRSPERSAELRDANRASRDERDRRRRERSLRDRDFRRQIDSLTRPGERLGRKKGGNGKGKSKHRDH
jgi:hypothetical protein